MTVDLTYHILVKYSGLKIFGTAQNLGIVTDQTIY